MASILGVLYLRFVAGHQYDHTATWFTPGDLDEFSSAGLLIDERGGLTHLYTPQNFLGLESPPGYPMLVALLLRAVGMGAGQFNGIALPAFAVFVATTAFCVLFGVDAVARRLGVGTGRRVMLQVGATAGAAWMGLCHGHPEDAFALAFLLGAIPLCLDGRTSAAAWLIGLGCCIQPLVVLAVPVLAAVAGARKWPGMALRIAAPVVAVVAIPLAGSFRYTLYVLGRQPIVAALRFGPQLHMTPFVALTPVGPSPKQHVVDYFGYRTYFATASFGTDYTRSNVRLVAIVCACLVGWWAARHRRDPVMVVWAIAVALSLRGLVEAFVAPYYLVPSALVCIAAAAAGGRIRLAVAAVFCAVDTAVMESYGLGEWPYYLLVTSLCLGGLVSANRDLALPRRWRNRAPALSD